jgi:hypothetical protein
LPALPVFLPIILTSKLNPQNYGFKLKTGPISEAVCHFFQKE